MRILVAVNTDDWDGKDLVEFLQMKGYETLEAKSSFALFKMLETEEFDMLLINQRLHGLSEKENYVREIRDIIPVKSHRRVVFNIHYDIEKLRDELINQHFFDFLVGRFNADELLDIISNPRNFDDVRQFQIRQVKKTIEKDGKDYTEIDQEILATKVLPNKIIGFHGATSTTTILNTAAALSLDEDLKIVVVDMNPNAHLSLLFSFDRYPNLKCMSELIECIRKEQLNKETIQQFFVQHSRMKNVYLLPGFKTIHDKNFFDMPEAEEGKYMEKIMNCLKRAANIIMVDTPRQFFYGSTIDTVKEAETMYFVTTPFLPHRIDIKTATKFFSEKKHDTEFKLVISKYTGMEPIKIDAIFDELKVVKEYSASGKEIGEVRIFDDYFTIGNVSNMSDITEDRKYAYEVDVLESYKNSINKLSTDIYYYQKETLYGKKSKNNRKGFKLAKKLPISNIFNRRNKN